MNDRRARRISNLWTHSLKTLTLIAWLGVWTQRTAGQGLEAMVLTAGVGETAILTAPVTTGILVFSWYRGTGTPESQLIIGYTVPTKEQTTGPQSTGRESVSPDGTLTIRGLQTSDNGSYTVSVTRTNTTVTTAYILLRVHEMVPKPSVTSEPLQLVENQGPAVITCNASTAATTILWSFNSSPNLPANILPSSNNRTLRIANVSLEDSGIYQCVAMNPVSINASEPRNVTVAFGPKDVKIDPPGPLSVQIGTALSLKCTAKSFPDPRYQWSLNGTELRSTEGTVDVSSRDNRTYTCVAYNNVTGLTAKASVSIVVWEFFPTVAPKPEGLSGGAIAGIVIAALVVVAGVAALVYFFVFKKPASGTTAGGTSTEMTPKINEAPANGTAAEIQYSSVNFVPKRGTTEKPIAPENTVYSEVRR